jgi:hypothetical protein
MTYIKSVRTSQEKHYLSATKINWLILFRDATENHTKHANALCGQNAEFYYVKAGGT